MHRQAQVEKAHDALRHLTGQEKKALAEYLRHLKIEAEYGRIYSRAFKHRLDADYKDEAQFDAEKARQILSDAERFVARLEKYLRSVGAIE